MSAHKQFPAIENQNRFDLRCEWGEQGATRLAPDSDVVVIVDILSFTTCVDIAVGRGATIYPYQWKDMSSIEFARSFGAEVAGRRGEATYSLSPASYVDIPSGTHLVLPSPNGSTISFSTGNTPTLAGCLRNAEAIAHAAMQYGKRIAIIPAGERWKDDKSLRAAWEDLVGAGAIIEHLGGSLSPEAQMARAAFRDTRSELAARLMECVSGRELTAMGHQRDVGLAAELNVSACVPVLRDGAYASL